MSYTREELDSLSERQKFLLESSLRAFDEGLSVVEWRQSVNLTEEEHKWILAFAWRGELN